MEDLLFVTKHLGGHQLGPGVRVGERDGGGGVNVLGEGGRKGRRKEQEVHTHCVARGRGERGGRGHTSKARTSTSSKHILAWCQKVLSSHMCTKLGRYGLKAALMAEIRAGEPSAKEMVRWYL